MNLNDKIFQNTITVSGEGEKKKKIKKVFVNLSKTTAQQ